MEAMNYLLFCVNLVLIAYLSYKIQQFGEMTRENKEIERQIKMLVQENTKIAGIIMDELDTKITKLEKFEQQEGHAEDLAVDKNPLLHGTPPDNNVIRKDENDNPKESKSFPGAEVKSREKKTEEPEVVKLADNQAATRPEFISARISRLQKQGFSVEEIAEKLTVPQGEIRLQINLQNKMKTHTEQNKINNA